MGLYSNDRKLQFDLTRGLTMEGTTELLVTDYYCCFRFHFCTFQLIRHLLQYTYFSLRSKTISCHAILLGCAEAYHKKSTNHAFRWSLRFIHERYSNPQAEVVTANSTKLSSVKPSTALPRLSLTD